MYLTYYFYHHLMIYLLLKFQLKAYQLYNLRIQEAIVYVFIYKKMKNAKSAK